jgi:16S rRNA (guanine966-N2)-methyltransferase
VIGPAMRIIGGQFRGKHLATPKSDNIRPTSDRLRETLFNILAHGYDDPVRDARVIDLFAGTGALGFEALSRGARFATFVEEGAEARGLIRTNIEAMALGGKTRLFRRDATRLGAIGPTEAYSLAFLDPPYGKNLASLALASLAEGGWLSKGALCVVEEATDAPLEAPAAYALADQRDYTGTRLSFFTYDL